MVRQKIRKHLAKAYRQMLKIHKFVLHFADIAAGQHLLRGTYQPVLAKPKKDNRETTFKSKCI